jgi:transcriptional regulator with XRE-family HTH domain
MPKQPDPAALAARLPARLRALREAAGWSQAELAQAAGVSQQAVNTYERGERCPSWEAALRLAAALGVPVGALAEAP